MPTQKEITEAVASKLATKDMSNQAKMVLRRATEATLKRIQQDTAVQLKENSAGLIENFCKNTANRMLANSQKWFDQQTEEVSIFPAGTRLIYQTGEVTSIIIEEAPQLRTISILNRNKTKNEHRRLAFPYTVFVVQLCKNQIAGVYAGVRKSPLNSLEDVLDFMPLPNVDENHRVCLGNAPSAGAKESINRKVEMAIGGFWQSVFTDSHIAASSNFLTDNQFSHEKWENESEKNPLAFKNWKYRKGMSIRGLIEVGTKAQNTLIPVLKADILEAVANVGGEVIKILESLDFEKESVDSTYNNTLQGILKEIITQAYGELWEYTQNHLHAEREKLKAEYRNAHK